MSEITELNKFIHERLFHKCVHELVEVAFGATCTKCEVNLFTVGMFDFEKRDYTSSLEAAFEVLREVERRGLDWQMCNSRKSKHIEGERRREVYQVYGVLVGHSKGSAETLPLAICRAAKAYLESETK